MQRHADLRLFLYVFQQLALDERPGVRQRQPPNVESGQQVIIDPSVRRDEVCSARQGVAHNLNLQIVAGTEREAIRRRLEPFETQQIRLRHCGEIGEGTQLCGARRARVETRAARALTTDQRCQRQSAQQTETRPLHQGS